MNVWIPDYEPSDHEHVIETLFATVDSGNRGPPFPVKQTILLCFTNRSGSSFLAASLASTGSVNLAREYLNHPMVTRRSARFGIRSFDEYLRQLAGQFGHEGVFALKVGLSQLMYLARLRFIGELLPDPNFILIERDDRVAQAISWVIALHSGQWTSIQGKVSAEPEYDFQAINNRIDTILRENAAFRTFLSRNGLKSEFVRYEQLKADPAREVKRLAEGLGLGGATFRAERVEIDPQRSPINDEWKHRYLEEVRSG